MTPRQGDYATVSIPWVYKTIRGHRVRLPNLMGYIIRLFTWSRYDHAFIYLGAGMIMEAQPKGARVSRLSEYGGDKLMWSATTLTNSQRSDITEMATSLSGTPYGFLDILYLGLATLGVRFKWLLRQVEREDRLICSQLVAKCGESAKIYGWLCGETNACLVTPADLAKHANLERRLS